jgi:23S rRNA (cytidine1920-2'-O)/16S rRNA (cytidine1409-2'-O)-methyltransferase
MDYSPITGPKGNIEFIAEMRKKAEGIPVISSEQVRDLVREAHAKMDHPV